MLDSKFFDELAEKLSNAVPSSLKDMKSEMEKNFKAILQSTFSKLDLVTREEFDVQTGVLQKTRNKLDELEMKLEHMENIVEKKTSKKK